MGTKDKLIDAYIAKSAPFAKPILNHLRSLVHRACPDVQESMKWSFPHFGYHGMMCSMAGFKTHCVFGFWKAPLIKDTHKILERADRAAMGHLGRIEKRGDLPADRILLAYITEAMKLNAQGISVKRQPRPPRKELTPPADFLKMLKKNKKAAATYKSFSPSNRRDYLEWIIEAKTDETRARRIITAVAWMADEKPRNWKYMKK